MEQPPHTSSNSATPAVHLSSSPAVQPSFLAVPPVLSSAASPPGFSSAMAGERLLLQPTSAASTVASIISLSHTHQVISLKLTNTNYLYWRMQMLPYLLGQGVFSFVDGSNICLLTHVLAHDGISLQVNPLFQTWKQQDQLILSALLSSLSMEVLHLVVGCQSSCSAWGTLERALASTFYSHIMQLHSSLQDLRQGDESVTQFMQKAKALFDELAAAGRPVSLEEFNLYVFRGLRGEFKDLVTSLITKAEPLSYADLHNHLLTHKFLHKSSAAIHAPLLPTPSIPSSALVAQHQTFGNSGHSRGHFNGGWHPNQSNSRGNRFVGSRPDHRSFQNSSFGDNRQGSWQRNRGQNPRCQLCQNFGHTAPHCPQFQQRGYGQQPTANLVQRNLSSTGSVDWFPDTGANQHVTPDLATLTASEPYLGNDNLHVGDGKGLPISHLGHTKIYTPHRSFTLSNVLHVPAITKPLLSV